LAQAIGQAAIQQGYRVLYRETHVLLDDLSEAVVDGTRKQFMEAVATVPLLIIDDFGMRQLPLTAPEDLLEIVMRRYERASTLLTSNRPVEDWGKLLGDVAAVTAIVARLWMVVGELVGTGVTLLVWRRGGASAGAPTGGAPRRCWSTGSARPPAPRRARAERRTFRFAAGAFSGGRLAPAGAMGRLRRRPGRAPDHQPRGDQRMACQALLARQQVAIPEQVARRRLPGERLRAGGRSTGRWGAPSRCSARSGAGRERVRRKRTGP